MPRGGFHNHPVREVECKACRSRFTTREPGRRAWYCADPDCAAERERKRKRRSARRVAKRRSTAFGFLNLWRPLVEAIEGEVRLQVRRPRDHEPSARLAQALRLLAGAREMEDLAGQREALREIAVRALAWEHRLRR